MDPGTGRLYESMIAAVAAGVERPVEIIGTREQAERISAAVAKVHSAEQKAAKRAKNKAAKKARRINRGD